MTLDEYQVWAMTKFLKEGTDKERISSAAIGLAGETGEMLDKIKKQHFHKQIVSMEDLRGEAGDVLFYLSILCSFALIPLSTIVDANVEKLNARYPNGFDTSRAHAPGKPPSEIGGGETWPTSAGE